jgi:HAE1 family hydrophobic/amphiphilic exporter-1/multidrug efflux pump
MMAVFLAGIVAYPALSIAPLPQVDFPTIVVSAALPGASPETMGSSVTTPLERQFGQISGITQMTSTSSLGLTTITLQFDLSRNIDGAAQDVQAAINAASGQLSKSLPNPPVFRKVNTADSPILVIAITSDNHAMTETSDYADTILAQQISQLSGVAQVLILGEQKPAVRIQLDPLKLASVGLGLEEPRTVLAAATLDGPKGSFDGAAQSHTIYASDQLLHAAEYNDIVLGRNGSPIRVGDVGTAVDGPENARIAGWANGRRGVQLAIFRQPGANIIATADRVKSALPRLQSAIPPGIDITMMTDRTQTIRASVDDVQITMLVTIALVVLVIYLFLRDVRATAIVSISVPMSIVGTCAVMYTFGYSLDNLSLMGLSIAVGFVVDDAIVMLENIFRQVESGTAPLKAAITGSGQIGFTIISISLSLIAVFIPLLFMSGLVGRLFREFAVTVSATIVISAFVSLTLTPMMCAHLLANRDEGHGAARPGLLGRSFDGVLRAYEVSLLWVMRHQRTTLAALLFTVVGTGYLYLTIPKGFFPQQDTGFIFGLAEGAQDVSVRGMMERELALADIVAKDPDIATFAFAVGPTGGGVQTTNNGRFWINLKPTSQRSASADDVINRLRPQLARVSGITLFMQVAQDISVGGRVARTQFQYTLQGADLVELIEWGPRILDALRRLPELQDIATDQQTNAPAVTAVIDRDTAGRFGIGLQLIDDTLYDAFGQRPIAQYFTQLNQYRVILEISSELQTEPEAIEKIYVRSSLTGEMVPLSAFVRLDTAKTNYLSISHQSQFPSVTFSFNLTPGTALGTAVDAIRGAETTLGLPATLNATFQGSAQAFQSALVTQPYLIVAAIIVVYLILGMLYESYIHPITILSTLPSAGVGALLMLILFHYDLSMIALIGIILLIGIVKKNAIMMIDFALDAERHQGLSPEDSIYRACLLRFRPILMTTMAALLGGLPLMLSFGAGSELRRPLGFTIVGGLLLSQWLTLYTTPVVYLYFARLTSRQKPRRASNAQRLFGAATLQDAE